MKILTRDFGEMEIEEQEIIQFEGAIYGFEELKKFVFLFQEDVSEHFVWLQSVEDPAICFILVEPTLVTQTYQPEVSPAAQRLLGPGDLMCWLTVVIKEDFRQSTVNMKSPIIVNPHTKRAAQVILEQDYPIHHPLLRQKEDV